MRTVLKTIDSKRDLDYDDTFTSERNIAVRRSLISELKKALAPNYRPSASQLTKWLQCLHKSRRSKNKIRKSDKIVAENRRVHNNNRVQDVSIYYTIIFLSNCSIYIIDFFFFQIYYFRKKYDE
jgi:hypothetical protein